MIPETKEENLRSDKDDSILLESVGKVLVLGKETVARVHCLGAGLLDDLENARDVQVALGGGRGSNQVGLIGVLHVLGLGIGLRVDGHGLDAQALGGANDTARNLTSVGNLYNIDKIKAGDDDVCIVVRSSMRVIVVSRVNKWKRPEEETNQPRNSQQLGQSSPSSSIMLGAYGRFQTYEDLVEELLSRGGGSKAPHEALAVVHQHLLVLCLSSTTRIFCLRLMIAPLSRHSQNYA